MARRRFGQRAHPDVAERDRGMMVLKLDRRGIAMRLIFGDLAPDRAAEPWLAVLHEHAVEEGGDIGRAQQLAVGSEVRPLEDDVVTRSEERSVGKESVSTWR